MRPARDTIGNSFDLLEPQLDDIARLLDESIDEETAREVLAPISRARAGRGAALTGEALLKQLLKTDCLRVAVDAINADGKVSSDEVDYVYPLAATVAGFLARERKQSYAQYVGMGHDQVEEFLQKYREDEEDFGYGCRHTKWCAIELCRQVAERRRDSEALDSYERLLLRVIDELFALEGVSSGEQRERRRLRELIFKLRESGAAKHDRRAEVFCDKAADRFFSAVAYTHQLWERDPQDVPEVHRHARDAFERLVEADAPSTGPGKMLLILGESGSGKTHLARAFRTYLHRRGLGYAGYLQLATVSDDYPRYALCSLIDSLDHAYDPPETTVSGLVMLSDTLAEWTTALTSDERDRLREEMEAGTEADELINRAGDRLLRSGNLDGVDLDLLRALLYLQLRDPAVKARVLKYLRCEDMSDYDRKVLGNITSRTGRQKPQETLEALGLLIAAVQSGSLVLIVDQLEDVYHLPDFNARIPLLFDMLRAFVEKVRTAVVVVNCIDDMYAGQIRKRLPRSMLDRLEREPEIVRLVSSRNLDEIEALVSARLRHLFESTGTHYRDEEPVYPIPPAVLEPLRGMRTRDVLERCRMFQHQCSEAGEVVEGTIEVHGGTDGDAPPPPPTMPYEQLWNDTLAATPPPAESADALLAQLADAASEYARAFPGLQVSWKRKKEHLFIERKQSGVELAPLLIGICNKGARAGALTHQVDALRKAAKKPAIPVVIRCSEFPGGPTSMTFRRLGELVKAGGRRVVVEDSHWRTLLALNTMRREHRDNKEVQRWLDEKNMIADQHSMREIFEFEGAAQQAETTAPVAAAPVHEVMAEGTAPVAAAVVTSAVAATKKALAARAAVPEPMASAKSPASGLIHVGITAAITGEPATLPVKDLAMHAAFLGSTGSGKTTVALSLLEQLLEQGIPCILIDRKGDLCGYARDEWGSDTAAGNDAPARARRLRESVQVNVYTPGEVNGRPLSIPVIPPGLASLPSHERGKRARQAAAALGAMMHYKDGNSADQSRAAILGQAIDILSSLQSKRHVGLPELIDFIDSEDAGLVNAVGRIDIKHYKKLVEHLSTLRLSRRELLDESVEQLNVASLLGRDKRDKTALSIISTKFIGDTAAVQFWVARFLAEVGAWASKNPSGELQAAILFDEADLYLPATSKPPTKEPMLDLLKRARSAGLGIMIATQNPGDLDYKCRENIRNWFLGRISDKNSVDKMKPLLSECRTDVSRKLANSPIGQFFQVSGGAVSEVRTRRSLLKTDQLPEELIIELARRD